MKKYFKLGDIVSLKYNLKVGSKYGGLKYERNMCFFGAARIEWINNDGLVKLSNGYYYTTSMLSKYIKGD